MTTFGLVHGAWHGAWCWERLVTELEVRGHRAVAVDLPSEDPKAGLRRYAELTAEALDGESGEVVVVGHSLGGLSAAIVPTLRPVRHVVFLCAFVPIPGGSLADRYSAEPETFVPGFAGNTATSADGASYWPDPAIAARLFYHDCSPVDAAWAVSRLRPQAATPRSEPFPLASVPDVERSYVLGRDERVISPHWSRRAARELLGVEAIELDGGHSPFLARPAELADVLDRVVRPRVAA